MTDTTTDTIPDATEFEHDPEPFGDPRAKPRTSTPCRVVRIAPYPRSSGPAGFVTVMTIGAETPEGNFDLSIDDRSGRFLLGCLLDHYLNPFQSSGEVGTPSADALKPSASSQSPAEILAHAESR
jgi:hypothetical protein